MHPKPKLLQKIENHPAVDWVSVEPETFGICYFVYLKPGWFWSEQKGFGCETLKEAWRLVKASKLIV